MTVADARSTRPAPTRGRRQDRRSTEHPYAHSSILVVDNEPDILVTVQALLQAEVPRAKVLTAPSGLVALDILATQPVDLIVSDCRMPGMDGIEFLVLAMRMDPRVPRVLFTTDTSEGTRLRAFYEAQVQDVLDKAMSPGQFVRRITDLLLHRSPRGVSMQHPSESRPRP